MNERRERRDRDWNGGRSRGPGGRGPGGRGHGGPSDSRSHGAVRPRQDGGGRDGGHRDDRGNSGGGQGGGGRHRRDRDRFRGPRHGGEGRDGQLQDFLANLDPAELDAAPRGRGVLEINRDGSGFLRTADNNYLPGNRDLWVPRALIDKWRIREGSELVGPILPAPGNRGEALVALDTLNAAKPEACEDTPHFRDLITIDPLRRLLIELPGEDLSTRVVDLFAPMGFGQRALIVAPPRSGKTILMQQLAQAIAAHHPEAHLMTVLIDERPEEVTDFRRKVKGEVIASSLDRMASGHVRLAEIVLERARRMVEMGRDVVIFLDSLTRLARAYNREAPGSGRTLSGGLDSRTMEKPREFFGSARNTEGGGSLTIIATCLVDTGSRMDQVIFEDFKGTGNMELILDRSLAERRIFPAIDINGSGTRREEKLRTRDELDRIFRLRRMLASYKPIDAMEMLLPRLRKTQNNGTFLMMLG